MPKSYALETIIISLAIVIAMVFFLKSQWGH